MARPGALLALERELVELLAGEAPLLGDHLGRRGPAAPGRTSSMRLAGSGAHVGAHRHAASCSRRRRRRRGRARPAATAMRREVDGRLPGAAEAVQRDAGHLDRPARGRAPPSARRTAPCSPVSVTQPMTTSSTLPSGRCRCARPSRPSARCRDRSGGRPRGCPCGGRAACDRHRRRKHPCRGELTVTLAPVNATVHPACALSPARSLC